MLKTLQNDSTRHLLECMDEMQIEKAMEGLKVVKERRKSSITKKKKKTDNSNSGNDRHNSKKEESSLDINIAAAAASLNEHGEKSRRSGKGSSSSRGKSPKGEDEDNSDADDNYNEVGGEGEGSNNKIAKEKSFSPTPVVPTLRRAATRRRAALLQSVDPGTMSKSQWKPLSEPVTKRLSERDNEELETLNEVSSASSDTGGIGGLWLFH